MSERVKSERRLRMMEPRDLPAVWRLARAQNRRDGTSYPVPEIFEMDERSPRFGRLKPTIALALVTERGGRVRQAHVWIRTVEGMEFGGGREDTEFSIAHMPLVAQALAAQGYADEHVFVPKMRVGEIGPMLEEKGLRRSGLAHYYGTLDELQGPLGERA